ncbi:MAG TPA: BON domain-containing protein [Longimicrobiaceae bacterium]|jgi:hypothetical protein|nr:BON domain-containing protein [Longimicrobiaceae bacterium]
MLRYDESYGPPPRPRMPRRHPGGGYDWPLRAAGGYDRGVYGGDYPGFGGYPGGGEGIHYGGVRPSRGRGYDGGYYVQGPLSAEEAYRRREVARWGGGGGHEGREREEEWQGPVGDSEVAQLVRERIRRDTHLDGERIKVSAHRGVVTLTGEVDDYLEARYAWDDAWESPGVRGVVSDLAVRTADKAAFSEAAER